MAQDTKTEPLQLTLMKQMQKLAELRFVRSRMETRQEELSFELSIIKDSLKDSTDAIAVQERVIAELKVRIKEN